MAKYAVTVIETIERDLVVEADSPAEAQALAERHGADDYFGGEIEVIEESKVDCQAEVTGEVEEA
jgi:hypothetical protein